MEVLRTAAPPGELELYGPSDMLLASVPLFAACIGLVYSMRAAFRPPPPDPGPRLVHGLCRRLALIYLLVVAVALYAISIRLVGLSRRTRTGCVHSVPSRVVMLTSCSS